jgi:outer membrane protein TolC
MKSYARLFLVSLAICAFGPSLSIAQTVLLTPDEAVQLALAANYDIQLSKTDAEIARLNNTKGNAGMLPTVNFVANENVSINAFQQKVANGSEFVAKGALFNNANLGLQLSWTLFDGRRMHIAKNRLEANEQLGELNLKATTQNTVANVLLTYYDIVRGKLQEKALQEVIALNTERLRIAEARLAAGFAAQTDALQARIDLNQRRADLQLQQTATIATKRQLNRLLLRPADTDFDVLELTAGNYAPDLASLTEKVVLQNPSLAAFQKSAAISALLVEEARALGRARITGLSQFSAARIDNGAGLTLNNTQAGLTVGASLVVPLYTGGNQKRLVETARLAAEQSAIRVENQRDIITTDLQNQLANLQTQRSILGMEEENITAAREGLNISMERFRVGQTNGLEIQTAQNTLEQVLLRRNLVLFNLKVAELRLKLLAGEI